MKNQFVPLEVAILLKEKGFIEKCLACYTYYSEEYHFELLTDYYNISTELRGKTFIDNNLFTWLKENKISGKCYVLQNAVALPLYQQVCDWFREEHDLHIMVSHWINQPVGDDVWDDCYQSFINGDAMDVTIYQTYNEALDYAINEALKLI